MENPYILFTSGIQSQANFSEESEMFSFTLYLLVCRFCTADCILRRILYPIDLYRAEVEPHFHKIILIFASDQSGNSHNLYEYPFTLIICTNIPHLIVFFFSLSLSSKSTIISAPTSFASNFFAVWWIDYSFVATFTDCCSRFGGQFHLCKTHRLKHRLLWIFSHTAITALQQVEVNYA